MLSTIRIMEVAGWFPMVGHDVPAYLPCTIRIMNVCRLLLIAFMMRNVNLRMRLAIWYPHS
jgi:hypothetical protein